MFFHVKALTWIIYIKILFELFLSWRNPLPPGSLFSMDELMHNHSNSSLASLGGGNMFVQTLEYHVGYRLTCGKPVHRSQSSRFILFICFSSERDKNTIVVDTDTEWCNSTYLSALKKKSLCGPDCASVCDNRADSQELNDPKITLFLLARRIPACLAKDCECVYE